MRNLAVIFFTGMLLWGCESTQEAVPVVTGSEYFPISAGDTLVYHVVKSDTSVSGNVINSNYYLKELVQDTFINASYGIGFKIDRFINPTFTTGSWVYDSTWYAYKNAYEGVRVENNIPYVKLSFPIKSNKQWNGNVKNVEGENMYRMINIDRKYQLDQLYFPRTLLVLQTGDTVYDRIVGQNKRIEMYAANVGLIYKELVVININSSATPIARSGVNYRQKLVSYGKK